MSEPATLAGREEDGPFLSYGMKEKPLLFLFSFQPRAYDESFIPPCFF